MDDIMPTYEFTVFYEKGEIAKGTGMNLRTIITNRTIIHRAFRIKANLCINKGNHTTVIFPQTPFVLGTRRCRRRTPVGGCCL